MNKIHLFIDSCANLDGGDFTCEVVKGGDDQQLATLLGKVVKNNPELLKAVSLAPFRAMYELGIIGDEDLYYATETIEDGNLEIVFELTEFFGE